MIMNSKAPNIRDASSCEWCVHFYMESGMPSHPKCKKYEDGGRFYMVCDDYE